MTEQGIIQGDCLEVLPTLPAESVDCVVTSPPYWGLRDYGTARWEGGECGCDHRPHFRPRAKRPNVTGAGIGKSDYPGQLPKYKTYCGKCGATRVDQQLGLESTPEAYVEKLVAVFREVRRVLKASGTVWLNLGDSYANTGNPGQDFSASRVGYGGKGRGHIGGQPTKEMPPGLKPKDLVGIPWRVAFALQADGWWLRSDIIWAKPNPMPESVTDRPTKSHEYLFLLTKAERYYYDAEAIKEPVTGNAHARGNGINPKAVAPGLGIKQNQSFSAAVSGLVDNRNRRTVWTIATQPYPEAHFATFPEKLVEPCILAGCPEGGTVLDPFAGAGATGVVAVKHGREFIGIELNPEYVSMAERRIEETVRVAVKGTAPRKSAQGLLPLLTQGGTP